MLIALIQPACVRVRVHLAYYMVRVNLKATYRGNE